VLNAGRRLYFNGGDMWDFNGKVHATASIRAPRRPGRGCPAAKRPFSEVDDRLGAAKLEGQALFIAQQLGVFGRQRIGGRALGAALGRLIGASVALTTPIGESRGIEPLASQDGTAAAGPGAVDFGQDPGLVGSGECPSAARPVRELGRGRRIGALRLACGA
jgi:hypothetical protein